MATEKKIRAEYKAMFFHLHNLGKAIWRAEKTGTLEKVDWDKGAQHALYELEKRLKGLTEKSLAKAAQQTLENEVYR